MKRLLILMSVVTSLNASAVIVAHCPSKLKVTATTLELNKTEAQILNLYGEDAHSEEIKKIRSSFQNLRKTTTISREFPLDVARNGKCVYRLTNDAGGEEKVQIYTDKGRDVLYFQTIIGHGGSLARIYSGITRLTVDKVELDSPKPGLSLAIPRAHYTSYSNGGGLMSIGNVSKLTVTAK